MFVALKRCGCCARAKEVESDAWVLVVMSQTCQGRLKVTAVHEAIYEGPASPREAKMLGKAESYFIGPARSVMPLPPSFLDAYEFPS